MFCAESSNSKLSRRSTLLAALPITYARQGGSPAWLGNLIRSPFPDHRCPDELCNPHAFRCISIPSKTPPLPGRDLQRERRNTDMAAALAGTDMRPQ